MRLQPLSCPAESSSTDNGASDDDDTDYAASEGGRSRGGGAASSAPSGGDGSGSGSGEDSGDFEDLEEEGMDGVGGGGRRRRGRERGEGARRRRGTAEGAGQPAGAQAPAAADAAGGAEPAAGPASEMEQQVLESLAAYIKGKGGELPAGWSAKLSVRPNGSVLKTYVAPGGGSKLRSTMAVARHLGLMEGGCAACFLWVKGEMPAIQCLRGPCMVGRRTRGFRTPKAPAFPNPQPPSAAAVPKRPPPGPAASATMGPADSPFGRPTKRARAAGPEAPASGVPPNPELDALRREALGPLEAQAARLCSEAARPGARRARLSKARRVRERQRVEQVGGALAGVNLGIACRGQGQGSHSLIAAVLSSCARGHCLRHASAPAGATLTAVLLALLPPPSPTPRLHPGVL
jgi:hypothetical protein